MTSRTCPRCGATYDDGGRFCPKDGAALRASPDTAPAPGVLVDGRYEIRRRIGSGGMGVVYLADDIRLGRPCAIKVLRTDALAADSEAVARFYREATNASRISHPHVVAIYAFDETENGLVYLATEYVEGQSLADRLEALSVLSPRPTARIVWQVGNALNAAHRLSIAHRDLKPANVMLTRYGEWRDFVKVVDFGIARAFGTHSGSTITTRGQRIGTPAYMSPEQWIGARVDHRTDIYSLGLLAVRMLAGGLPPIGEAGPASAEAILGALPPNDWPAALMHVLHRGLARDPDDRFQTAKQFSTSFVFAVEGWVPPDAGVQEPWEAKIRLPSSTGPHDRVSADRTASDPPVSAVRSAATDAPASSEQPASPPGPQGPSGRRISGTLGLAGGVLGVIGLIYLITSLGTVSDPPTTGRDDPGTRRSRPVRDASTGSTATAAAPGSDAPSEAAATGRDPSSPAEDTSDSPSTGAVAALVDRLSTLVDLSEPDPDSIRAAAALARSLRSGPLSEEQRLEVGYRLAEASLFLGDRSEACSVLREIRAAAAASEVYGRAVRALLDESCRPDPP